ncbi:hypothetical protein HYS54_02750 [Candidatus Micrarchaeota archaeon]|nr:hypothetical protein [Candidatus Micrarchaeota archaeon]
MRFLRQETSFQSPDNRGRQAGAFGTTRLVFGIGRERVSFTAPQLVATFVGPKGWQRIIEELKGALSENPTVTAGRVYIELDPRVKTTLRMVYPSKYGMTRVIDVSIPKSMLTFRKRPKAKG